MATEDLLKRLEDGIAMLIQQCRRIQDQNDKLRFACQEKEARCHQLAAGKQQVISYLETTLLQLKTGDEQSWPIQR